MADEELRVFTRRDLLRSIGTIGAAAAVPVGATDADPHASHGAMPADAAQAPAGRSSMERDVPEHLTANEADTLEAMCARIIPTDASGPGAKEARAARYIDRALGGALANSREAYRAGLASVARFATSSKGKPFHELSPADQDAVLTAVAGGSTPAGTFTGSSATFFNLVRSHTMQGTFGDPFYGGNANFVGWDLIGYPGVRTQVTATDQQQLEKNELKPNHRSAYDTTMFTKATVRLDDGSSKGGINGDEA